MRNNADELPHYIHMVWSIWQKRKKELTAEAIFIKPVSKLYGWVGV